MGDRILSSIVINIELALMLWIGFHCRARVATVMGEIGRIEIAISCGVGRRQ